MPPNVKTVGLSQQSPKAMLENSNLLLKKLRVQFWVRSPCADPTLPPRVPPRRVGDALLLISRIKSAEAHFITSHAHYQEHVKFRIRTKGHHSLSVRTAAVGCSGTALLNEVEKELRK